MLNDDLPAIIVAMTVIASLSNAATRFASSVHRTTVLIAATSHSVKGKVV